MDLRDRFTEMREMDLQVQSTYSSRLAAEHTAATRATRNGPSRDLLMTFKLNLRFGFSWIEASRAGIIDGGLAFIY